ncbi:MAG: nucleoside triphosphate pyrophosphohydrolase [Clostridia bacterium]|nr:nucleoside triphosphate pyrophosphohydrolase [Clostridia bacterium]
MSVIHYDKLVRDRIPEIIAQSGRSCQTRVLTEAEFLERADAKLDEELREYQESKSPEELADLLEVIYAAAAARGVSAEALDVLRRQKAEKRGRFEKRLLLIQVSDEETR